MRALRFIPIPSLPRCMCRATRSTMSARGIAHSRSGGGGTANPLPSSSRGAPLAAFSVLAVCVLAGVVVMLVYIFCVRRRGRRQGAPSGQHAGVPFLAGCASACCGARLLSFNGSPARRTQAWQLQTPQSPKQCTVLRPLLLPMQTRLLRYPRSCRRGLQSLSLPPSAQRSSLYLSLSSCQTAACSAARLTKAQHAAAAVTAGAAVQQRRPLRLQHVAAQDRRHDSGTVQQQLNEQTGRPCSQLGMRLKSTARWFICTMLLLYESQLKFT